MHFARCLALCNGLLRDFPVDEPADSVAEYGRFIRLPTAGGKLLQVGNASSGCQRKDINDYFIDEMIDGKSVKQFKTFPVRNFSRVGKGIILVVFLGD